MVQRSVSDPVSERSTFGMTTAASCGSNGQPSVARIHVRRPSRRRLQRFEHCMAASGSTSSSSSRSTIPEDSVLTVENRSGRSRRLSVTAYAEWALALARGQRPRIVTALEPETQALLVRNPWNTEFAGRVAFLDLGGRQTAWTADRTNSSAATAPRTGRRPGPRIPAAGAVGAGWILAPPADQLRARQRARTQVLVLLGELTGPRRRPT